MSSFNLVRVAPGLRVETCDNDIRPYIWNLNGFEALLTPPGDLFSHSGKGRGFLESVLSTPLRHTSISQVRCLNFFFAQSHAPEAVLSETREMRCLCVSWGQTRLWTFKGKDRSCCCYRELHSKDTGSRLMRLLMPPKNVDHCISHISKRSQGKAGCRAVLYKTCI